MKKQSLLFMISFISVFSLTNAQSWTGASNALITNPAETTKVGIGTAAAYTFQNFHIYNSTSNGTAAIRLQTYAPYMGTNYYHNWDIISNVSSGLSYIDFRFGEANLNTTSPTMTAKLRLHESGWILCSKFIDLDNGSYFLDPASTSVSLSTAGDIQCAKLMDKDNTTYYIDPSLATLSINVAGTVRGLNFYDINNPNYFIDPAGSTSLNIAGKIVLPHSEIYADGSAIFDGRITAKEVEIKLNVWPDYVFKQDYQLRTLSEVEHFIKLNNHLPEMPSEKDVLDSGINIGEMNVLLLKKIEELTLYVIDLEKQVKELKDASIITSNN